MLAYCGFDVIISFGAMQATLHLPAFTKGIKSQLSAEEVKQTRTIANVCTHVECVVNSVQQRFPILQSTYNCRLIFDQKKKGEKAPLID